MGRTIETTVRQAVDYWKKHVAERDLSIDWAEADRRCWRCGCERNLERAHIVPDSLGGEDAPHNIVLLCKRCHIDGPNVKDPEVMWDWIRAYGIPFYGTFWDALGAKEYRFIYKESFYDQLRDILDRAGKELDAEAEELFLRLRNEVMADAGIHFGHPYFNTATMAGINRMLLKKLAAYYGVPFPVKREEERAPEVWWLE